LFKVVGRERVGRSRYSRYIVMFSTRWPEGARSVYLVSTFTSLYPGRFELARFRDKGFLMLSLWDDLYPYWFSVNGFSLDLDGDNDERVQVRLAGLERPLEASLARIGVNDYAMASSGLRDWVDLVVHDERSPIFISKMEEYTVLRLWLPRGVVDNVILEYKCSGQGGFVESDMELVGRSRYKDYYEVWVKGGVEGYIFKLRVDGKVVLFGRDGVGDGAPITPGVPLGYNEISWWVGATYYMVFVDSFERAIEKKGVKLIDVYEPREPGYYGGDLIGLLRRIDHVKLLGFDALYLTPIYVSASYHRYDVIDHFSVDPLLGGEEAFEKLLEVLRSNGLKLVLDIVVHHTSPCHKSFLELLNKDVNRMYRLVRRVSEVEEGVLRKLGEFIDRGCRGRIGLEHERKPFYESFASTWHMPKLDHSKSHVRSYVKRILSHWLKKGADGFRFDVGHAIPDGFMKEYYDHVKRVKGDAVVIAEVTVGVDSYPLGTTMDSATNYDLREYLVKFFVLRELNAHDMEGLLAKQYSRIPVTSALSLINLLGSHDTPRIKTIAMECYPDCIKRMYFTLFILPGAPTIYYGDEIGMEGSGDPDCRRPMIWDVNRWDKDLLNYIKRLLDVRRRLKALRYGSFKVRALDEDTMAVYRSYEGEHVLGIVTREKRVNSVELGLGGVREVLVGSVNYGNVVLEGGVALLMI
jgi:glycosidase